MAETTAVALNRSGLLRYRQAPRANQYYSVPISMIAKDWLPFSREQRIITPLKANPRWWPSHDRAYFR